MDDFKDNDKLKEMLETFDIDSKMVYQLILSNGIEIIAELLPFTNKTKKYVLINPIKVSKESFLDEDMLINADFLSVFDSKMEEQILEVEKQQVTLKYKVDKVKLEDYVYALYNYYFPLSIEVDLDIKKSNSSSKSKISKSNIISFVDYKDKRIKGLF